MEGKEIMGTMDGPYIKFGKLCLMFYCIEIFLFLGLFSMDISFMDNSLL